MILLNYLLFFGFFLENHHIQDVYDLVLKEVSQRNALKIQARRGKAAAAKELEQKSVLSEYKPKKFDAAKGGLAKILEV